MKSILRILFVVLALTPALSAKDTHLLLDVHWDVATQNDNFQVGNPAGQERVLRLAVGVPQPGHPDRPPLPYDHPRGSAFAKQAFTKDFWLVTAQDGKSDEKVVKFQLRLEPNPSGEITTLLFFLDTAPKKGVQYRIRPKNGSFAGLLKPGYTLDNADKFLLKPVDNSFEDRDVAYIDGNKALEPHVSVKQGKDSTVKVQLYYGRNTAKAKTRTRLEANLDAEVTYKPKVKNHFVNKINGEIDFLYDDKPRGNPNDFVNFLGRYGLTSRIEADQEFDDVDQTFGASAFLVFNGAALQAVADALLLNGSHDGNAPSALFSLSYEYVANYKTDPALGTHSTDVSTDRARAHLYWSAKILRQLDFTKVPYIGEHYDLDLVIDTGISYDRRNAEWLPDVNLTMELGPTDPKSDHVSFVVTYLNGKTKARFENYDGILAGIKKAF